MCTPGKLSSLFSKRYDWELLGKCSMSLFAFVKQKFLANLSINSSRHFPQLPTEDMSSNFFLIREAGDMVWQEERK